MSQAPIDRIALRALQCLRSRARHGSFAEAGLGLGVAETKAGQQLRSLEHRFDAKLFDIHNGKLAVTVAGRRALQLTAELFDQARLAMAFHRHQHSWAKRSGTCGAGTAGSFCSIEDEMITSRRTTHTWAG